MDTRDAADDRKKPDGRGPFEKFVEAVNQRVSRAPFFMVILAALVVWAVSYPLWSSTTKWELALHTVSSVLSLLLLVLLENAGRRSEEAAQEKLNVLADGLAALMGSVGRDDPELQEAHRRLTEAVGLRSAAVDSGPRRHPHPLTRRSARDRVPRVHGVRRVVDLADLQVEVAGEALPEPLARPQHHRGRRDRELVDQPGLEGLPDDAGPAADRDVLVAGDLAGLGDGLLDAVDEPEARALVRLRPAPGG